MKLAEVKAGDTIVLDDGFTCAPAGPVVVQADERGETYFPCTSGKHFLDGQTDDHLKQDLVGVSWPEGRDQ